MAELFLVRPVTGGDPVVLKRLLPHANPEIDRLFRREAEALAALSSPYIASFMGSGPGYLLVEYVDGCDLATVLRHLTRRGQRLPVGAALRLVDDILAGAAALHAAGLVHRDLNPRNVMVGRDGRARLIDLGIVKRPALDESTVDGLKGTLAYMAPEQLAGEPVSAATDVYAIGLIAYELLAGVSLAPSGVSLAELGALRSQLPQPASAFGAPRSVDDALGAALSPSPGRRPESAAALREALSGAAPADHRQAIAEAVEAAARSRGAVGSAHTILPDSAPVTPPSPSPSVSRALIGALAVGLILGGAMLGWLVGRGGEASSDRAEGSGSSAPPLRSGASGPSGALGLDIESSSDRVWTVKVRGRQRHTPFSLERLRQGATVLRILGADGTSRGAIRLRKTGGRLVVAGRAGVDCGRARRALRHGGSLECRVPSEGGLKLSRR